ncbi:MAG: cation diffusion facilitator family transporter [Baekduia sp.]
MSTPDAGRSGALGVARLSIAAALLLIAVKLTAGLASGSLGLVAEAAHSGTDLVAAILTFAVLRVALRPPDEEHQYGHGKAEHLAALAEGAFLALMSAAVAVQAIARLTGGGHELDPSWWLAPVLALVIAIDAGRVVALRRAARDHRSAALSASAVHFASDLVGTLAVVAGIALAAAGWPEADAIAALVVATLVVYAAGRLVRENAHVLMDRAPTGVEERVRSIVRIAEPDAAIQRIRVRTAASHYFVEIVVGYRADAGLGESHAVADAIEEAVEREIADADVIVHVEPAAPDHDLRARASAAALTVRGVHEVHNVRVTAVDGTPEISLHLKLPSELPLADAHDVATAVEEAIGAAIPGLSAVHTHVEPLAAPEAIERPQGPVAERIERGVAAQVRRIAGAEPEQLSLRETPGGVVVLLTVSLPGDQPLTSAHDVATRIEHEIRDAVPEVADVVVHTEPSAGREVSGG